MASYVKSTNFAVKDGLPSGDPQKVVKGTEIDTEFNNIATAVGSKADLSNPQFLGTPFAPTASPGTNTTQIATTAFVKSAVDASQATATITGGTITGITNLEVNGGATGSTAAAIRANLGANNASNLTTGTVDTARLGTGSASASTVLHGDGTWKTPENVSVSAGDVYSPLYGGFPGASGYGITTSFSRLYTSRALSSGSVNLKVKVRNGNNGAEITTTIYARAYVNGSAVGSEAGITLATNTDGSITLPSVSFLKGDKVGVWIRASNPDFTFVTQNLLCGTSTTPSVVPLTLPLVFEDF
jgi:hypothetical protein